MASNPHVNKIEYAGQTLMDLTGDTATPSDVLSGATFHDRSGTPQTGNLITHNVYDGLDSTSTSDALSANQGKILNNYIFNKLKIISSVSGDYKNTGTGWEYVGLSFTVPTYYRYFVTLESTWNSGKCVGLGLHGSSSISSPYDSPKYAHVNDGNVVEVTPMFSLPSGTYYLFSKRASASNSNNGYAIKIISFDTRI